MWRPDTKWHWQVLWGVEIDNFHCKLILFWTNLTAKKAETYSHCICSQLIYWVTGLSFSQLLKSFPHFGWIHKYNCSIDRSSSPVLFWNIWTQSVLISYFFHFNTIPHLLLHLQSILAPVSPPQLSLYFSPKHGTGPTYLILLCSTYTVPSVGTFYCPSSSTKRSHQNTQSHISVRFQKNRSLSHIKQRAYWTNTLSNMVISSHRLT